MYDLLCRCLVNLFDGNLQQRFSIVCLGIHGLTVTADSRPELGLLHLVLQALGLGNLNPFHRRLNIRHLIHLLSVKSASNKVNIQYISTNHVPMQYLFADITMILNCLI